MLRCALFRVQLPIVLRPLAVLGCTDSNGDDASGGIGGTPEGSTPRATPTRSVPPSVRSTISAVSCGIPHGPFAPGPGTARLQVAEGGIDSSSQG